MKKIICYLITFTTLLLASTSFVQGQTITKNYIGVYSACDVGGIVSGSEVPHTEQGNVTIEKGISAGVLPYITSYNGWHCYRCCTDQIVGGKLFIFNFDCSAYWTAMLFGNGICYSLSVDNQNIGMSRSIPFEVRQISTQLLLGNNSTYMPNNTYSPAKTTCPYCNGTGKRCKYHSVSTYGTSGIGHTCQYCGQWLNHGDVHTLERCTMCNGTGLR